MIWNFRKKKLSLSFAICCLFAFLLLPCGFVSVEATSTVQPHQQIMMQQETRSKLLRLLAEQQTDLTMLKMKLTELKESGTASQQRLTAAADQLQKAQLKLDELQQALTNAKQSLNDATVEIEKLQKSLAALQVQVKALQKENSRLKRQNKLLQFSLILAGSGLVYMAAR